MQKDRLQQLCWQSLERRGKSRSPAHIFAASVGVTRRSSRRIGKRALVFRIRAGDRIDVESRALCLNRRPFPTNPYWSQGHDHLARAKRRRGRDVSPRVGREQGPKIVGAFRLTSGSQPQDRRGIFFRFRSDRIASADERMSECWLGELDMRTRALAVAVVPCTNPIAPVWENCYTSNFIVTQQGQVPRNVWSSPTPADDGFLRVIRNMQRSHRMEHTSDRLGSISMQSNTIHIRRRAFSGFAKLHPRFLTGSDHSLSPALQIETSLYKPAPFVIFTRQPLHIPRYK